MYDTIKLSRKKFDLVSRRHPWIFSGAIESDTSGLKEGEVVRVCDHRGLFFALGHFHASTIAVRILSFEDTEINAEFFRRRIEAAVVLRKKLGLFREDNQILRLVHGEGDGLPGLIVDYYAGVAIIQCHSIGMHQSVEWIVEGLKGALKEELTAVYEKSSGALPERVGAKDGYRYGTAACPHQAKEHGIQYAIDWVSGQKTGFFIDQRENRALLGKYARDKKVLNCFCYTGGFSLAAIQGGATEVVSLDSSRKAIELTEENVRLNGMESKHRSVVADAMEYMKELGDQYDIIILDPPAFAKHRNKRHQAVQGYKRLNLHAMRQIRSGGLIFTFSCSQVVDKTLFTNTIIAAAMESGRRVRILEQLHQPADHPIDAYHPEGEYLKGLVIEVSD
ncbi:MAG: class I SAM-dependent rRNA methyltransferase [Bacteroidetes bacterium]|nr:MAG: class I SAM-dependent rRNA methyltransferase [Bacteroidota bacterium]